MILTGLAFRHRKETAPLFTAFWLASLGACVLLALLHLAGLFWGIPQFVQAIPLRATLLLVMFSLPLVMAYLAEKLRGDWFLMRWAAAALLLLVAFFGFGVFWGPILALLFSDLSEGSLGPIKLNLQSPSASWFSTASWVVLIGWIGLIFATRLPGADGRIDTGIGFGDQRPAVFHQLWNDLDVAWWRVGVAVGSRLQARDLDFVLAQDPLGILHGEPLG